MIRLPWRRQSVPEPRERPPVEEPPGEARDEVGWIRGERGASVVAGARSLQSRMSSLLAAGLMASAGGAVLAWYYAQALSHPAAVHGRLPAAVPQAPGAGMMLPVFGPVTSPAGSWSAAAPSTAPAVAALAVSPPAAAQSAAALPAGALLEPPLARTPGELPPGDGMPAQPSPRQQALDRRLAGRVFAQAMSHAIAAAAGHIPGDNFQRASPSAGTRGGALASLLRPAVLAATRARLLPDLHLLLPEGTFIDCTLETAIDSTLPGMTTCVTATDTFSADGTVVLLERGTKLIGQTRGEVRQGQARVFVVWTEARTPAGVVVRLDSPGTDALGRAGLEGRVDRHFWQRFGAAALISTIDGAVQSEVQSSSRGGTVVLDPTASEDVLTGILRGTVDIPPTVRVRNGARIQVLVARDIDFRSVYELEPR
jgi:type IV secretion system protein VirB10